MAKLNQKSRKKMKFFLFKFLIPAFKNLYRSKSRTTFLVLTLLGSICTLFLISGFYNYLFRELKSKTYLSYGDGFSNVSKLTPARVIQIMNTTKGISAWYGLFKFEGIAGVDNLSAVFSGFAIDSEQRSRFSGGKLPRLSGVILGSRLASALDLQNGSDCNFLYGDMNGVHFRVEHIINTQSLDEDKVYVLAPLESFKKLGCAWRYDQVRVKLKKHWSFSTVAKELKSEGVLLQNNFGSDSEFSIIKQINENNFCFVIIGIILFVFLGSQNVFILSIFERKKELGIFRCLGFSKMDLGILLILEALVYFFISLILAVSFSYLCSYLLDLIGGIWVPPPPTYRNGYFAKISLNIPNMVFFSGLILVSVLLASVVSISIFLRKHVMENLNEA